jgi:hypothetical protein
VPNNASRAALFQVPPENFASKQSKLALPKPGSRRSFQQFTFGLSSPINPFAAGKILSKPVHNAHFAGLPLARQALQREQNF